MGVSSTSQKGWKITKVRKCNIWPSNRDFFSVVLPKSKKFQNVTFRAQFAKFSPRGYMQLPRGHPGYPQIGWKVTKVTKCNFWPIFFDFSPVVLPKSQKLVLFPPPVWARTSYKVPFESSHRDASFWKVSARSEQFEIFRISREKKTYWKKKTYSTYVFFR